MQIFNLLYFAWQRTPFKRYVMGRSFPSEAIRRGYYSSHRGEPSTRRSIGTSTSRLGRVSVYCWRRRAMEARWRYPLSMLLKKARCDKDILKDWALNRRLLIDVRADHSPEAMMRILELRRHSALVCSAARCARSSTSAPRTGEERTQMARQDPDRVGSRQQRPNRSVCTGVA